MSVSPSPDADAEFLILFSDHQDGLAKDVVESVIPRLGGSARVVRVRGRPSPRSGSDDDENRAPSWFPQVPLITTIAEPTGVGGITGRRSKRAYPPDSSHDVASLQQQDLPRVFPTSEAVAAGSGLSRLLEGLDNDQDGVGSAWLILSMRLCACVWVVRALRQPPSSGQRAMSQGDITYTVLRYATLRARRLENRVPCRLPFPRIERQAISKVCVLPTPPHVVGERHGCESRA